VVPPFWVFFLSFSFSSPDREEGGWKIYELDPHPKRLYEILLQGMIWMTFFEMLISTHGLGLQTKSRYLKGMMFFFATVLIFLVQYFELRMKTYLGIVTWVIPVIFEICFYIFQPLITADQHMEWILKYKKYRVMQSQSDIESNWNVPPTVPRSSPFYFICLPFGWMTGFMILASLIFFDGLPFWGEVGLWLTLMTLLHLYSFLSGCCLFHTCFPQRVSYYRRSWSYVFCFFQTACPYWMFHSMTQLNQNYTWFPFSISLFCLFYSSSIQILLQFSFISNAFERMKFLSHLVQKLITYFLSGLLNWSFSFIIYVLLIHIIEFFQLSGLASKLGRDCLSFLCCSSSSSSSASSSASTCCTPQPFSQREILLLEVLKWKSRWMNFIHQLLAEFISLPILIFWMTKTASHELYPFVFYSDSTPSSLFVHDTKNLAQRIVLLLILKLLIWLFSKPIQQHLFPLPFIEHGACPFDIAHRAMTNGLLEDEENVADIIRMGSLATTLEQEHQDIFTHRQPEEWTWSSWMNYKRLLSFTFFYSSHAFLVLLLVLV
jgi:hypothetical protein